MPSRFNPIVLTVATLPSAVPKGQRYFCSDCLTPWGTGSDVTSDGTSWRLPSGIIATTTPETYLISRLTAGLVTGDGQYDAGWVDRWAGSGSTAVGTQIIRTLTATGAGSSITPSAVAVTGTGGVLFMTSGTTATGLAGLRSAAFDISNQGYDMMYEVAFNITALSTATDEFHFLFAMTDNATSGSTADANIIGLLYDRAATWGAGGTNTNWKIITRKAGVGTTFTETSVAVATGTHSLRIYRTAAGTTAHFWIDGVQRGGDVTSNVPAAGATFRLGYDMQNTAKAGAATNINLIKDAYALRRSAALYS